jgi:hypothetical protein
VSSITNLTSAPSALPLGNIQPHGHKKGSHVQSTADSDSATAAPATAGAAQNPFGSLLQSLEQAIGVQFGATAPVAAPAAAPTVAATAASTTTGAGTTSSTGATPALTSAGAASYLQANGSQTPRAAGSNVSVNA